MSLVITNQSELNRANIQAAWQFAWKMKPKISIGSARRRPSKCGGTRDARMKRWLSHERTD